jgi:acyl carrier protein
MDDAQILNLIKEALFEVAPSRKEEFDEELTFDMSIEDLALDSIATMEMVGFLEDKTEKTFPDEELAQVNSIKDLASLVKFGRL